MRNDGATPIVERDETVLEAVEETISNVVKSRLYVYLSAKTKYFAFKVAIFCIELDL